MTAAVLATIELKLEENRMRNQLYENFLNEQGVPWDYLERVELSAIDSTKSLANQARLEVAVLKDEISQYRAGYERGDHFPPLVVHRPGKKFVLLDGNQRFFAASPDKDWKGLRFHDAYLVDSKDEVVLNRIAWTINDRVNGRRMSYEDNLQHAMTYVRKYNWTRTAAAKEFGINERALHKLVHIAEMKDKLHEQKVSRLPNDECIERLSPLSSLGDDVFSQAARMVAEIGSSSNDVQDLVKKVRRAKTHADKMATIAEYGSSDHAQARKAETKGGRIRPRSPMPRERLRRALTEARKVLEDNKVKSVMLPVQKADLTAAQELARDVVRLLGQLYGSVIFANAKGEAV